MQLKMWHGYGIGEKKYLKGLGHIERKRRVVCVTEDLRNNMYKSPS